MSHIFLPPYVSVLLYPLRSFTGWGRVVWIFMVPRTALQCGNWPHNDANAQIEELCMGAESDAMA